MADLASVAQAYRASLRSACPLSEVWSAASQTAKRSRSASSERSRATPRLSRSWCFTATTRVRAGIRSSQATDRRPSEERVKGLAVSSTGETLVTGGNDGLVKVWDLAEVSGDRRR